MPALVDDARTKLAPLSDDVLVDECTGVAGTIGLGASQSEKTEWITMAVVHLGRFPGSLVREALREAPIECERLNQVVKFVATYCEDYPARMQTRLARLEQLDQMARDQGNV
ncbi:MAG: hypothetical protein V4696_03610 [Pseudomonadota bacterium]